MKIVETLTVVNAEKTFLGPKDLKLMFDTESGEVTIDAPAMFTDPVVNLSELKETLEKFDALREQ